MAAAYLEPAAAVAEIQSNDGGFGGRFTEPPLQRRCYPYNIVGVDRRDRPAPGSFTRLAVFRKFNVKTLYELLLK